MINKFFRIFGWDGKEWKWFEGSSYKKVAIKHARKLYAKYGIDSNFIIYETYQKQVWSLNKTGEKHYCSFKVTGEWS